MASLTSRALKKAKYVCENAARGKFPSSDRIKLPAFNYDIIDSRQKNHWLRFVEESAKKRLTESQNEAL